MPLSRRNFISQSGAFALVVPQASALSHIVDALLLDESPVPMRRPVMYSGGDVSIENGRYSVWPDLQTPRILIGGASLLGFELRSGGEARLPILNRTTSPISIHWHGLDVPAEMDGHPKDAFSAGTSKVYSFPVRNRAGLYFFHSHSHMATAREVYLGMAGLVIVRDEVEEALKLPSGEYELPIMIQDVRVDAQGQINYAPTMNDMMNGWMGNRVLVNCTPNATQTVKRGTYRLRIVNASNARMYKLQLSNNQSFTLIGVDGGLLERPQVISNVMLSPAERIDILVDFSDAAPGADVRLVSAPFSAPVEMMAPVYPQGIALDVLRFTVSDQTAERYLPPDILSVLPETPNLSTVKTRAISLAMARGMGMGMRPTINGKTYDIDRVDFEVDAGGFEVWEFQNTENAMYHPMHIHGRQFRVLSRSGGSLLPTDLGLKDTVLVAPRETVRVLVHHSDYEGMFLFHCHNLEHEDEGMMQNYVIRRTTSVSDVSSTQMSLYPNPATDHVTIRSNGRQIDRVVIVDTQGRVVYEHDCVQDTLTISIAHLPVGLYTVTAGDNTAALSITR